MRETARKLHGSRSARHATRGDEDTETEGTGGSELRHGPGRLMRTRQSFPAAMSSEPVPDSRGGEVMFGVIASPRPPSARPLSSFQRLRRHRHIRIESKLSNNIMEKIKGKKKTEVGGASIRRTSYTGSSTSEDRIARQHARVHRSDGGRRAPERSK